MMLSGLSQLALAQIYNRNPVLQTGPSLKDVVVNLGGFHKNVLLSCIMYSVEASIFGA